MLALCSRDGIKMFNNWYDVGNNLLKWTQSRTLERALEDLGGSKLRARLT